ncbi:MAG: O-antigen ligase family protein [Candidatus Thorarchaeota archaeon]
MLNIFKKIELALFYLFIFSIPLEKRHVFETAASRIDEHFIEWNSASLYLSDILLGLVILFWIIRFFINKYCSSEAKRSRELDAKIRKKPYFSTGSKTNFFLLLIFSIFILISLISALNSQFVNLSLYHLFKLLEYGVLFFYVISNIKTIKKVTHTLLTFIASSFLQAILGIAQYLKQGSFNLKIFGEVDLSPVLQNISKIDVEGTKMIRAYGTFPHSNVLAGFLFISIIFTICLMFIILNKVGVIHELPLLRIIKLPPLVLILYILSLGLLLTFSRSGWLACLISILFIIISILFLSPAFRTFLVNQFRKNFSKINIIIVLILFIGITLAIFWPQITSRDIGSNPEDEYSVSGRTLYNYLASDIIKDNLLLGVGPGLFVNHLGKYLSENLTWWQLQPVHNVYLLILAEQGLLGFIAFIIFIFYILSQIRHFNFKQKGNDFTKQILIISFASILFSLFIIMLFDHYLWDIQQGVLCFFLILGLFYTGTNLNKKIQQK